MVSRIGVADSCTARGKILRFKTSPTATPVTACKGIGTLIKQPHCPSQGVIGVQHTFYRLVKSLPRLVLHPKHIKEAGGAFSNIPLAGSNIQSVFELNLCFLSIDRNDDK